MKYKLPGIMYFIRIILFVSVTLSLCFLSNATSAVIFLIAVSLNCAEFYIESKYMFGKIGSINGIVFGILDRLIVVLPLLYLAISNHLKAWVLLIVLAFEVVIFLYRLFDFNAVKYKRTLATIYIIYNITLYISIFCLMLGSTTVGAYFLFASTILAGVFVIFSSIVASLDSVSDEDDGFESKDFTNSLLISEDDKNNEIAE